VTAEEIKQEYLERYSKALVPAAGVLEAFIREHMAGVPRIDRIGVRAKAVSRFVEKALKEDEQGNPRYGDPLNQIQDQLGARIVTFYLSDVIRVADQVKKYLKFVEAKQIVPDSESEFGYFGQHFIVLIPSDVTEALPRPDLMPTFFELQVKTLYQHAWAEANHDLAYKPSQPLTIEQKRSVAYTAAQSWGADRMFEELHQDLIISGSGNVPF
jgi:putative GTP pyrophosphokinase